MPLVNIDDIDQVLEMIRRALEKAGHPHALQLVKDKLVAECAVCGIKITGADLLSEQRQLLSQPANTEIVIHRGPDALVWKNFAENKCVKPDCNSNVYRLQWQDPETKRIYESVLSQYEIPFPLPENIQHLSRTLKSDLISFQTGMSLAEITRFYRAAFRKRGLKEYKLLTSMSEEHISLAFLGLPGNRMVVVQAVDLGYKTEQDQRYVSLRTEPGPA